MGCGEGLESILDIDEFRGSQEDEIERLYESRGKLGVLGIKLRGQDSKSGTTG